MRRHRVYMPDLRSGRQILPSGESDHLRRVLRCRPGDAVRLFDGTGHEADGVVNEAARAGVTVEAGPVERRGFEATLRVTIAAALPRGPRQPSLFEKCTELGAWAIWPMLCERSVARAGEGSVSKWRRTVIEACRQSGRAWATRVEAARAFEDVIASAGEFDLVVMAHVDGDAGSVGEVLDGRSPPRSVLALVGPEGGWSAEEAASAARAGAVPVRLGPFVMRVETASMAAVALLVGRR